MSGKQIRIATLIGIAGAIAALNLGCEGVDRKHDYAVENVDPPPVDAPSPRREDVKIANFADLIESMMATRQKYLDDLKGLEKAYLNAGDTVRADWARRQRSLTADVMVYPYLTEQAPEQRVDVAPLKDIPEADAIYREALKIHDEVRLIPLAGALEANKEKARKALALFKRIIKDYPQSDKVDDAAFFIAEIYKEYLREDDPNDELSTRYYAWAVTLDPNTPHPARFQAAVVYDFRRHNRDKALEMYHQVLDLQEANNQSNCRFAATRIEQLSDEDFSHLRPVQPRKRLGEPEPGADDPNLREARPAATKTKAAGEDAPLEPDSAP